MRRSLKAALSAVVVAAPMVLVASQFGASAAAPTDHEHYVPHNATTKIAGPPALVRHQRHRMCRARAQLGRVPRLVPGQVGRAPSSGATSATTSRPRCSTRTGPGSGNNVTYQMVLPKDPPTTAAAGRQRRHRQLPAASDVLARHGHVRQPGLAEPGRSGADRPRDRARASRTATPTSTRARTPRARTTSALAPARPTRRCSSTRRAGSPGRPASAARPTQYCAALNIDTFSENDEHRPVQQHRVPEHGRPGAGELRVPHQERQGDRAGQPGRTPSTSCPNLKRDLLMNPGDNITVHLFDTANGLRVVITDHTTHTNGSMTASTANGFGNVLFDPNAKQVHDRVRTTSTRSSAPPRRRPAT